MLKSLLNNDIKIIKIFGILQELEIKGVKYLQFTEKTVTLCRCVYVFLLDGSHDDASRSADRSAGARDCEVRTRREWKADRTVTRQSSR